MSAIGKMKSELTRLGIAEKCENDFKQTLSDLDALVRNTGEVNE